MREYQVRICEGLGVQFPWPTRRRAAVLWCRRGRLLEGQAVVCILCFADDPGHRPDQVYRTVQGLKWP